ncbi:MAG: hypothetical protein ACOH1O_08020 [Flavobacterium sp.]
MENEKVINEYKVFLENYFSTLLEILHTTRRLNKLILLDIKKYSETYAEFFSDSALVLRDWSSDDTSKLIQPSFSDTLKSTSKENYKGQMTSVLSREFCLMYSQSYEALERFLKDCVFYKLSGDIYYSAVISKLYIDGEEITRENMKGGGALYYAIKKIGNKTLQKLSAKNNSNIKFKELFEIISNVRHSVTHSNSIILKSKINKSEYHFQIFDLLFSHLVIDEKNIKIQLDFEKFEKLIKIMNEFAFQIFKAISIEEKLDWEF